MSPRHAPDVPGVELEEVIGTGGSGIVYRGRQVAFDRPVAVKVSAAHGSDSATRRRWEREVAAVGRLSNHPNVVPVFDAGITDDGDAYLVMALAPSGTLGDRLREHGPLEPAEVADIGIKLAATLVAVHAAGVLHRDIKPDNVLWSPHGEPQLSDFGIARLADRTATLNTSVQATVSYAAPEVLAGAEATEATDVYGLGATLYTCLTGVAPHPSHPGEHLAAAVTRALEEDPPPLTGAGVPAGLARVVERAIARDPAQRPADAARLRHDLERAAAGLTASPAHEVTSVVAATAAAPEARAVGPEPTAVGVPVVAPAAPRAPDAGAPVDPPARSGRPTRAGSRALWLGVLAVVVLAVGLVLLQAMAADDDAGDGGDLATDSTAPAATEAPAAPAETTPTTEAPTTTAARETTTSEDATTTTEREAEPDDGQADDAAGPAEAAVTYLETLDRDDLDEAWAMTTSRFQAQQDRQQWERFWEGHDVDVVGEPRVDREAGVVIVPITYDGQREDYRLDVVSQGRRWLIDGPVGR